MNMKKIFSIFLAIVLLVGVIAPGIPVKAEEEHQHTYGAWTFDTAKGTQSRACSCGDTQVLHGTTNKAEQVTAPVVGGKYYLAANVAGTLQYFLLEGKVTDTVPYSLHVTSDVTDAKIREITLEDPSAVTDATVTTGFQLTFLNSSTLTRIYCYNAETSNAAMDTGTNTKCYKNRHNFYMAEVGGVKVIKSTGNGNVLAVKYNETMQAWRMLGVPESELANEGVYPAMLVTNHTHAYGEYQFDATKHWKECDCGAKTEEAEHAVGEWVFDTVKGIQTRSCACGKTEVLHGTTNKATQVTAPTIGSTYYLAANVNGVLQYFNYGSSTTDTKPYSLHVSDDPAKGQQVTLEDPTKATEGTSVGFQMTFPKSATDATTLRIYCYDVLKDASAAGQTGIMDTGHNSANYKGRHTFELAEVSGMKVLRKLSNNNILVVKYNETKQAWRMLGVPESELANAGVFPVMLVTNHTHTYGTTYEKDENQHWQLCDCGTASAKVNHTYTNNTCVCGATQAVHECKNTDGKWYADGDKHYQKCGTCQAKINQGSHTFSTEWTFDTVKGTQSKLCTSCQAVGETLHGTTNKATQVTAPEIGGKYYLAANVNGKLNYFISGKKTTDTAIYSLWVSDDPAAAQQIELEAAVTANNGEFQITFPNPDTSSASTTLRIYCYASVSGSTTIHTGHNGKSTAANHTFLMDEVNGVKVLRKYGNNYVLAFKEVSMKTGGGTAWRMLGVPESELANEGVYPVMLVTNHTHTYGTNYEQNELTHWQICDCGYASPKTDHAYANGTCVCGKIEPMHTCQSADGKWFADGDKHHQICGVCYQKINATDHTPGAWTFDTAKGEQHKSCTVCNAVCESLYGTTDKVSQVTSPTVGSEYYLVVNINGDIRSFITGSYTQTSPYSIITSDTLNKVTVNAALQAGKGDFQLVYDGEFLVYSVAAGVGLTRSASYVNDPNKVSFSMDVVNGKTVIRAFGTQKILAAKYSDAKAQWRIFPVEDSEIGTEGVYPVMLANLHTHSYSATYEQDEKFHWQACSCGATTTKEKHQYVNGVCVCGKDMPVHDCQSEDGKWFEADNKHYQLCGVCNEKLNEDAHAYGAWIFDTAKGTQHKICSVCNLPSDTLHGTDTKGYQVNDPTLGSSYYLAANVDGKLQFFAMAGSVTDTNPYSLSVTDDLSNANITKIIPEAPVSGTEGFQLSLIRASDNALLRIYCYASATGSATIHTGINAKSTLDNHTFAIAEVGGEKVLRKLGNGYVLAVKYNPAVDAYRMLGVPESELANEGVYPAMLMTLHEHTHTNTTYQKDALGHWFVCECGGKSNYEDHVVSKWTYSKKPTQTTGGQKTGTCTVCGGKAVVDVPALVEEGHYYLTGKLGGTTYYFRPQTGTESVEDTVPFSLMSTTKEKEAMKVNVVWNEKSNTYVLQFTQTRTLNIYMDDVNGNTVQKDGKVDLSASATTAENRILYRWDPVNKRFYQIENGERYVMAFKNMTFQDGKTKAVRMLAVPETELSSTVVPVQLKTVHIHNYSSKWQGDALNHWHECSCDVRKDEGAHDVAKWTVEKKATTAAAGRKSGTCSECGLKVVQAIPMLTDKLEAPDNGGIYYLVGTLNGKKHYFTHTPSGGSVADTYPYSLYTDPGTGVVTPVKVKEKDGNYKLSYVLSDIYLYISGDGVGMTSKVERTDYVDFQWDEENKVLYQMEGGVKHVLVMKMLRNTNGDNLVRITSMPLDQALIDPNVAIVRLTTQEPEAVSTTPSDATMLDEASNDGTGEEAPNGQTGSLLELAAKDQGMTKLFVAVGIAVVLIPAVVLLLMWLKSTSFGLVFFGKRHVWAGACVAAAGLVLAAAMILPQVLVPKAPDVAKFTIVANETSMEQAQALAVEIYEDHGISLPVVDVNDFEGDHGIYLNVTGFNSYGGYKYQIANRDDENGTGVYLDGTGYALETAISKWVRSLKKNPNFPFGMDEKTIGYEWNTGDVNMTGLGFTMEEQTSRQLYEGVELRELKYNSFAYGKNEAFAVIVDSDAPVELMVSAGEWDENTTTDNPGKKYTVQKHGKRLTDAGYEVLAITNAGFYDLNTTQTYIPWGLQIVDGLVKKEPNKDNPKNTDNWFGQTADGKFVISNTDGYFADYETKIANGVGGGLMLMKDGKPCFSAATPDYRTVVGITKGGDLVMLTISGANYAVVTQVFMDMGLEMDCVLNLDGGGSTTLHTLTEEGKLKQFICETPVEREVADAIAIVKKK